MNDETTNEIKIQQPANPPTITFHPQDNTEVGKLTWAGGMFKFEGDADESAKAFFNFVKPLVEEYIESEVKRRSQRIPGNWATEGLTEEMKKPADWPEDNTPNPADVARREFEVAEKATKRWGSK